MIKKDKIIELRIEEDDDVSGVDQISLVDEPAIEVNWIAFNKEKAHEFHIPDGEDDKYLQMLMDKGQPEEEILTEGFGIYSIEIDGKEHFVSAPDPNADSDWDENEFKVRYKYILSPRISGPSVISTTRQFCKELVNKNYVWKVEDMEALTNDFNESAMVWRGGYNCRHNWAKIKYKKDATIINKASVNKGKETVAGFPTDLVPDLSVLGYDQPVTVTDRVIKSVQEGTAKASTIRNLGLSKEKMEIVPPNLNIYGYHTKYFQLCPGAQATFQHLSSMQNDEDTIGMIRSAAVVADSIFKLEYDVINAENATQHEYEEAVVLVDDFKDIINQIDKISGMIHDVSYMDGHIEKIKSYVKEDMGYDVSTITGYVDPGISGVTKPPYIEFESYNDYPKAASENACKVLRWRDEHGDEVKGMTQIGWIRANQLCNNENISEETIARMSAFERHRRNSQIAPEFAGTPWRDAGYVAWLGWGGSEGVEWAQRKLESIRNEQMSKQAFATDEEKKIVVGPAMIPDKMIYRKDKQGNPYYVYFTKDTIKMIAEKFLKRKYVDNSDTQHNGKVEKDVYVIESWIKEDMYYDKANKYGFGDLPVGTWYVAIKVNNDNVWKRIKEGELKGFSVSGFFEEIEKFGKEEMLLHKINEILSRINE